MRQRYIVLVFMLVTLIAGLARPSAAQCAPRTDWESYTVQPGDVLFYLAGRYNTTVDALVSANCLPDRDMIFVGQTLYVPPQPAETASFAGTYVLSFAGAGGLVTVTMQLQYDGAASLTLNYENRGQVISNGFWEVNGDRAVVNLTERITEDRIINLYLPERLVFAFEEGFLVAVDYDRMIYGEDGLRFTIGSSDINPSVAALQLRLAQIGLLDEVLPAQAGLVDEATRLAVVAFQQSQGLTPTGIVDPATWNALLNPGPLATPTPLPLPPTPPAPIVSPGGTPDLNQLPSYTPEGSPILYLTFDDGPSPYTSQVLDLLAEFNAKATFFVIGEQAQARPDLIRAAAAAGHYIANHTLDHADLSTLGYEGFFREVEQTRQILLAAAGDLFTIDRDVHYLRPPYGATDAFTRQYAADLGYAVVLWTVDPQDWRRLGAAQIAAHIIAHAGPGSIVLMHDGGGDRSQTVAALRTVLETFSAQGYSFRTIAVGAS